jgi:hypothetical protein
MGMIKKIKRWLRDPRRSPKRRPINERSPVPLVTTQTVTGNNVLNHGQRSAEKPPSGRDEISQRMKEMVNRSTQLREAKNLRSPQNQSVYQERVSNRLGRVPTRNPQSNTRNRET